MGRTKEKGGSVIMCGVCISNGVQVTAVLLHVVMHVYNPRWKYFNVCAQVRTSIYLLFYSPGSETSQAERMVMAVAEIVKYLIHAQEEGHDVNLNKLALAL